MGKHILLFCNHYRREIEKLNIPATYSDYQVAFYPGHCGHPALEWEEIQKNILDNLEYDTVHIISNSCISGLDKKTDQLPGFHNYTVKQCFHLIANPDLVDYYIKEGYYLVTPGWLRGWPSHIKMWGFDQETAKNFFSESSQGILFLDTGVDSNAFKNLKAFSSFVDRPYQAIMVGTGFIDLLLKNIILQKNMQFQQDKANSQIEEKQKELSYYAMALDMLKTLTQVRTEDEVIQQIKEIFTMLFAPKSVIYKKAGPLEPTSREKMSPQEDGFALPISYGRKPLGLLELQGFMMPQYTEQYFKLASGMISVFGLALENAKHYQEVKDLSDTDGLTLIANRRRFQEYFQHEWERLSREQKPMSVIMCDIDYFKRYNDKYGHLAGDDCLRLIADTISSNCKRPSDLAARYGGEEFILILPETKEEGAWKVAENIQESIGKLAIPHGASPITTNVTVSLGISSIIPSRDSSHQTLILTADQALYEAKETGRNKIIDKKFKKQEGP